MRLRRSRREDEPSLIDMAPLIDMMFTLLIFFAVSTTFDRHSEMHVNLPQASAEPGQKPPEQLEIGIDVDGYYYINGKELIDNKLETLKNALLRESHGSDHVPLIISADGRAPHQSVITAMDAARQAGLARLSFATKFSSEIAQ